MVGRLDGLLASRPAIRSGSAPTRASAADAYTESPTCPPDVCARLGCYARWPWCHRAGRSGHRVGADVPLPAPFARFGAGRAGWEIGEVSARLGHPRCGTPQKTYVHTSTPHDAARLGSVCRQSPAQAGRPSRSPYRAELRPAATTASQHALRTLSGSSTAYSGRRQCEIRRLRCFQNASIGAATTTTDTYREYQKLATSRKTLKMGTGGFEPPTSRV